MHGWNAANFGWGGDTVQNILWRLQNGELDGVNPRVIVLMAGTNNIGATVPAGGDESKVADLTKGLKTVLQVCREKAPESVIVLMGITPRNDNPAVMADHQQGERTDGEARRRQEGPVSEHQRQTGGRGGKVLKGMSPDRLHLSTKGYQVWADALKPVLTEILGPPAKDDLAPPPTGDPSATGRPGSPEKQ